MNLTLFIFSLLALSFAIFIIEFFLSIPNTLEFFLSFAIEIAIAPVPVPKSRTLFIEESFNKFRDISTRRSVSDLGMKVSFEMIKLEDQNSFFPINKYIGFPLLLSVNILFKIFFFQFFFLKCYNMCI